MYPRIPWELLADAMRSTDHTFGPTGLGKGKVKVNFEEGHPHCVCQITSIIYMYICVYIYIYIYMQSEHNCVILSGVIQRISYMFRPLLGHH